MLLQKDYNDGFLPLPMFCKIAYSFNLLTVPLILPKKFFKYFW